MLIALLSLAHSALLTWAAVRDAPVRMEARYLAAGVAIIETGQLEYFPQNPPLGKVILALPGYAELRWRQVVGRRLFSGRALRGAAQRPNYLGSLAEEFVWRLGREYLAFVHLSRVVPILVSVASGWLLAGAAWTAAGSSAAGWAAFLWYCAALPLALGHVATADILGAFAVCTLLFYTARYLREPSRRRSAIVGLVLGLGAGCKTTVLALAPVAFSAVALGRSPKGRWLEHLSQLGLFGVAFTGALYVAYFFSPPFSHRPADWSPRSALVSRVAHYRVGSLLLAPLPSAVVDAVDKQAAAFDAASGPIWLWGTLHAGVVPGYYFAGLLVKEPLGVLVLVGAGVLAALRAAAATGTSRLFAGSVVWCLSALVVLSLLLASLAVVAEYRYAIPLYPCFALAAALGIGTFRTKLARACAILSAVTAVLELLAAAPHFIAFGNVACGGPMQTWKWIGGSAVDWGQDLYRVHAWFGRHPEVAARLVAPDQRHVARVLNIPLAASAANLDTADALIVPARVLTGERSFTVGPDQEPLATFLRQNGWYMAEQITPSLFVFRKRPQQLAARPPQRPKPLATGRRACAEGGAGSQWPSNRSVHRVACATGKPSTPGAMLRRPPVAAADQVRATVDGRRACTR